MFSEPYNLIRDNMFKVFVTIGLVVLLSGCIGGFGDGERLHWSLTPYAGFSGDVAGHQPAWTAGMSFTIFDVAPAYPAVPQYYRRDGTKIVNNNYVTSNSTSSSSSDPVVNNSNENANLNVNTNINSNSQSQGQQQSQVQGQTQGQSQNQQQSADDCKKHNHGHGHHHKDCKGND